MAAFTQSIDFAEKLARRLGLDPAKTRRIELICDPDEILHAIAVMDVDDAQAAGIIEDLEGADVPVFRTPVEIE